MLMQQSVVALIYRVAPGLSRSHPDQTFSPASAGGCQQACPGKMNGRLQESQPLLQIESKPLCFSSLKLGNAERRHIQNAACGGAGHQNMQLL